MSNAFLRTSAGNLPPVVPTEFTADDATTAIPDNNNLNVLSRDTIENNTNGIQTTADPDESDNLYIELTNRISVSVTTNDGDGQTQTVDLITPVDNTSISFRVLITGYDAGNDESAGGELIGLARASGGTLVVVGTNDTFDESDSPGLDTTDWNIIATASPILQIEFVGVAGREITWRALFEYTQAP